MEEDQQQFVHAQLPVHSQYDRDKLEYELVVRQEPKQARMCGVGADRRPIDPPPIVQLRVIDPTQRRQAPDSRPSSPDAAAMAASQSFLQNPYYFMFASLAKTDEDVELHWLKDGKTRCTTGSVVSSLYHLKDAEAGGSDAGFFVFPDLSVRTEGSYRLKLSLFEVVGNCVDHCKSIFSAPFYVYTAKKFPGMEESTPLSCSLADQGIKIRIRKDIRVRRRPAPGGDAPVPIPISGPPPPGGAFGPVPVRLDDPVTDEEQGSQERERRLSSSPVAPLPEPEREPPRRPDSDRDSDKEEPPRRILGRRVSESAPSTGNRRGSASDRGSKRRRGDSGTLSIGTSMSGSMLDGPDVTPVSAGPSSAGAGWGTIDPTLGVPPAAAQQSPATPTSSSDHHYAPAPAAQTTTPGYEHRYSAPPSNTSIPAPAPAAASSYSYEPHSHHPPPPTHHYSAPSAPHPYAHVPPQAPQHHASAYPYPPPQSAPAGHSWGYDPYGHTQPYMQPAGPPPAHHAQAHPPPPQRYPDYPPYAQQGYGGYYDHPAATSQHHQQQHHAQSSPTSHSSQHSYSAGYGPAPAPPSPSTNQAPAAVPDYYPGRSDNRSSSHVPVASTASGGYAQTAYAPPPPPTGPGQNPAIHHHYGGQAPVYSQYGHNPSQGHAPQQASAGASQNGASASGRSHYQLSTPPHHHQTQPYSPYPPAPIPGTSASASVSVAAPAPAETAWAAYSSAPGAGPNPNTWGVVQDSPYSAGYGGPGGTGRDVHGHGPRLAPLRVAGGTPPPGSEGGRGGSSKKINPLSIGNIISEDTG